MWSIRRGPCDGSDGSPATRSRLMSMPRPRSDGIESVVSPVVESSDGTVSGASLERSMSISPDQLHALVEVIHQRGQLHLEALAHHRRALRLDAHHQVAAYAAEAPGDVGVDAVAAHREYQSLAPHLRDEVAQVVGHRDGAQCR